MLMPLVMVPSGQTIDTRGPATIREIAVAAGPLAGAPPEICR
jgi:hypothetical protein